jgi:hypothetical protein
MISKWWFYPLLMSLFFVRAYASRPYEVTEVMELIIATLSNPLIFRFPALMPVAKLIPVVLIAGLMIYGNRVRRLFNGYVALLYTLLALFQTTAVTESFGLVVITGNLILILLVALLWWWEVAAEKNDYEPVERPLWRWWVVPVALFAFLMPVNKATMPDFNILGMLTNEAGLTYCMMTPVILGVCTLYYPRLNRSVFRISSVVGLIFGVVNMLTWFIIAPGGWWMGVLHLPLVLISFYAFLLSYKVLESG